MDELMGRRSFGRLVLLAGAAAILPSCGGGRSTTAAEKVVEYDLPPSLQTHEIIRVPGSNMALITQPKEGVVVKIEWLPAVSTGVPEAVVNIVPFELPQPAHPHGLAISNQFPGKIWCTLEDESAVLLLDPNAENNQATPTILQRIDLPAPASGPHCLMEYGSDLWITLKSGNQVLRIAHQNPADYTLYENIPAHPIFVARHPVNGHFYVSCDQAGKILHIDPDAAAPVILDIASAEGSTPVGLIAGPAGSVWFTLAGSTAAGSTGTFGRIDAQDRITYYRLTSPAGSHAGLLHLAFDPADPGHPTSPQALWLLSSSISDSNSIDSMIRVEFSDLDYSGMAGEELTLLPSQNAWAHRLLLLSGSVLATETRTSKLAELTRDSAVAL